MILCWTKRSAKILEDSESSVSPLAPSVGRGPKSGARLDDHVWPGANAAIMTAQDEAVIAGVMVRLQSLR